MIQITPSLSLASGEIRLSFIRAGGPGGQNVNKVATAVQLRFDVRHSPSLPAAVKTRLEKLAGSRLTLDGVIVMTVSAHRTQEANRKTAIERLVVLIAKAAEKPVFRVPTRPSLGSKKRRLEGKSKRGEVKRLRTGKPDID
mgnify:CR=1 FL=1